MSNPDMYSFEKKVRFYEQDSGRSASRKILISPMVHPAAVEIAKKLGIEVYTHTTELKSIP